MKISCSKIKGGACVTLQGRSVLPDYYEADVYWKDDKGSSMYIYATADTRSQAIKALKLKMAQLIEEMEASLCGKRLSKPTSTTETTT